MLVPIRMSFNMAADGNQRRHLLPSSNNNNNTYIAPISILLLSSALKNKNILKKY